MFNSEGVKRRRRESEELSQQISVCVSMCVSGLLFLVCVFAVVWCSGQTDKLKTKRAREGTGKQMKEREIEGRGKLRGIISTSSSSSSSRAATTSASATSTTVIDDDDGSGAGVC